MRLIEPVFDHPRFDGDPGGMLGDLALVSLLIPADGEHD